MGMFCRQRSGQILDKASRWRYQNKRAYLVFGLVTKLLKQGIRTGINAGPKAWKVVRVGGAISGSEASYDVRDGIRMFVRFD
jgi:hypothetical protein